MAPRCVPRMTQAPQVSLIVQDVAKLMAASKKDHLLERKLYQYNSDTRQWHEWFKNAIDFATLSEDVKMTNLKMLDNAKPKPPLHILRAVALCTKALYGSWSANLAVRTLYPIRQTVIFLR